MLVILFECCNMMIGLFELVCIIYMEVVFINGFKDKMGIIRYSYCICVFVWKY